MMMRTQAQTTVTVVKHAHGGGTVLLAGGDGVGVQLAFDYWETARMAEFVALLDGLAQPQVAQHKPRKRTLKRAA
jgi:hypothetical protein